MNAVAYDFSVEKILPVDEVSTYHNCLNFIKTFEKDFIQGEQEDLHDILEQATQVVDNMTRLTSVFEFLGAVELGKNATHDQDIMDNFEGFEQKLREFESFKVTVEMVREKIIRMLSRYH